jgi:hypothetical protein
MLVGKPIAFTFRFDARAVRRPIGYCAAMPVRGLEDDVRLCFGDADGDVQRFLASRQRAKSGLPNHARQSQANLQPSCCLPQCQAKQRFHCQ